MKRALHLAEIVAGGALALLGYCAAVFMAALLVAILLVR